MIYAKSLRAIGQSLKLPGLAAFIVEKNGKDYVIRSDALPNVSALTVKKDRSEKAFDGARQLAKMIQDIPSDAAMHYTPNYICWLDAQAQKRRRKRFSTQASGSM